MKSQSETLHSEHSVMPADLRLAQGIASKVSRREALRWLFKGAFAVGVTIATTGLRGVGTALAGLDDPKTQGCPTEECQCYSCGRCNRPINCTIHCFRRCRWTDPCAGYYGPWIDDGSCYFPCCIGKPKP